MRCSWKAWDSTSSFFYPDKVLATDWISANMTATATTASYSFPVYVSGATSVQALEPVRRPAPLEFSPYINATELVMEFLAEARVRLPGLTRERFLRLTIADFFAFLIRRAAEVDGVEPPEMAKTELRVPTRLSRCGWCARFLPRSYDLLRMSHCGVRCLRRAAERDGIALP